MRYADLSNEAKLQQWLDYVPTTDEMATLRRIAIRKFRTAIRDAADPRATGQDMYLNERGQWVDAARHPRPKFRPMTRI